MLSTSPGYDGEGEPAAQHKHQGIAFNSDFDEDQKDIESRSLVTQTMKVRKYFYENVQKLELTKARKCTGVWYNLNQPR